VAFDAGAVEVQVTLGEIAASIRRFAGS